MDFLFDMLEGLSNISNAVSASGDKERFESWCADKKKNGINWSNIERILKIPFFNEPFFAMRKVYYSNCVVLEFTSCSSISCITNYPETQKYYYCDFKIDDICKELSAIIPLFDSETYSDSNNYMSKRRDGRKKQSDGFAKELFVSKNEICTIPESVLNYLEAVCSQWSNYKMVSDIIGSFNYNYWSDSINDVSFEIKNIKEKRIVKAKLEATEAVEKQRREAIKKAGNKGEEDVKYALKWLNPQFKVINNGSSILVKNSDFMDESQELDHVIISSAGIIIIETKNYSGKIVIDSDGNWIRKKEIEEGIRNPIQQIRRHEKLLKSFLPSKVSVSSIICLANDNAIVEGTTNSSVPIVKCDMLVEYIENNYDDMILSDDEINECAKIIDEHRILTR